MNEVNVVILKQLVIELEKNKRLERKLLELEYELMDLEDRYERDSYVPF
jgi:hypothetical protein